MKLKTLTIISLATAVFASCSKEPKACFNIEVQDQNGKWNPSTTGKVGERFYFSTTCSENVFVPGTEFDYGDGTKGHEEGHNYEKPGNYTVKVTVFETKKGEKGEKSAVATQSVVVKDMTASN